MTAAITDFSHFTGLRAGAVENDPEAIREVAGQFEALFIQTMLKNMRDAAIADPIFGQSDQHEMYQDMMDQQLALEMASGRGIGLADMLVRQLGGEPAPPPDSAVNSALPARSARGAQPAAPNWSDPQAFLQDIWPHAERVAKQIDVAPEAIMAQAALETGWGAHLMRQPDGSSSNNFFGMKAGAGWSGQSVRKPTLEFEAGAVRTEVARFRAYDTMAANFDDYSALLQDNPRYRDVHGHGDDVGKFTRSLQDSGYATDPAYADKLNRVMQSEPMQNFVSSLKNRQPVPITTPLATEARNSQ